MEDEQKGVEPPKNKDVGLPLTPEEFQNALDTLFERAKAAGVQPIKEMAMTYARRGLAMFDKMMAALENDDDEKKKK